MKTIITVFILFSLMILLGNVNAVSSTGDHSLTIGVVNISENYTITIQNTTYINQINTITPVEFTNLYSGVYLITVTAIGYKTLQFNVNLTGNVTYQLYMESNVIGYGITNYDPVIYFGMFVFVIITIPLIFIRGIANREVK